MSKELILTVFTFALGLLPASCLTGCKAPGETNEDLVAKTNNAVDAAQKLGLEAEATMVLRPDGTAGLFSGFVWTNPSLAIVRVKADPAKAKLQDAAVSGQ